jgi:hypothetical protein
MAVRPRGALITKLKRSINRYKVEHNLFISSHESVVDSIVDQIEAGYYDSFPVVSQPMLINDELPDHLLKEWINIGTEIKPHYLSTRSTSQLENLHQVIHSLISGITSPNHADLLMCDFLYRWNISKKIQTKRMNFPKLFCPILYHKWLDAIQQARFSLISIDVERDSNPIRFKLWEVHAETGHYPLQELNIQEQRRDPSVQIGAWSVIANSVSQAAARSYINCLKDQLADVNEDVDTCEIEEEIHLFIRNSRRMVRAKRSGTTADLTEERMELTNMPIETAPALTQAEKLLIEYLLIQPLAQLHSKSNHDTRKSTMEECATSTEFVNFFNLKWLANEFNSIVLSGYCLNENYEMTTKPIEFVTWFESKIDNQLVQRNNSFTVDQFTLKEIYHMKEYLRRIGERKISERLEMKAKQVSTPQQLKIKRVIHMTESAQDFPVYPGTYVKPKKLKFSPNELDNQRDNHSGIDNQSNQSINQRNNHLKNDNRKKNQIERNNQRDLLVDNHLAMQRDNHPIHEDHLLVTRDPVNCPSCNRRRHKTRDFLSIQDNNASLTPELKTTCCQLVEDFFCVSGDKFKLKANFIRLRGENQSEAARRLWDKKQKEQQRESQVLEAVALVDYAVRE